MKSDNWTKTSATKTAEYLDSGPRTSTIDANANQGKFYAELDAHFAMRDKCETGCDFFLVGEIEGIEYYMPNDDRWGGIVAVSHDEALAHDTCFYEMDDMGYPDSDYRMIVVNGAMDCAFTFTVKCSGCGESASVSDVGTVCRRCCRSMIERVAA